MRRLFRLRQSAEPKDVPALLRAMSLKASIYVPLCARSTREHNYFNGDAMCGLVI